MCVSDKHTNAYIWTLPEYKDVFIYRIKIQIEFLEIQTQLKK